VRTRLGVATDGYRGAQAPVAILPTLLQASVLRLQTLATVAAGVMVAPVANGVAVVEVAGGQTLADVSQEVAIVNVVQRVAVAAPVCVQTISALEGGQTVATGLTVAIVRIDGGEEMASSSVKQWATKVGDTRYLKATLQEKTIGADDADASVLVLTGASVTFKHRNVDGTDEQTETVTVLSGAAGTVQVEWDAGSLATAGEREGQFVATLASGEVVTVPTDGAIAITVIDDYAEAGLDGC